MSDAQLYHRDWHLLAELQPRLSGQTKVARHIYRGEAVFIVQDLYSGRCHRFSRHAWELIRRFDGEQTLGAIWQRLVDNHYTPLPRQSDLVEMIDQLLRLELIELAGVERQGVVASYEARRARWKMALKKLAMPLSIKFPLWDPDRFLARNRWMEYLLTKPLLLLAYLMIVASGLVLAVVNWSSFQNNLLDAGLLRENLLLMVLTYPVIKAFHELAHAVLVRRWGGHVHEVGVMLLVFFPVPYVDATDASMFAQRYRRMAVGFAGIATELVLASLAMIVWVLAEPGIIRALAANVVIVGGISSVLFNGNPLVRFDAYYVLSDFWEIPNLAKRANDMFGYQLGRRLLGWQPEPAQQALADARGKLIFYALASFLYRIVIVVGISIYLTQLLPVFGVLLVVLFVAMGMVIPFFKALASGWKKSVFYLRKGQFVSVVGGLLVLAVVVLGWLPLPASTHFEALVLATDSSIVRAQEAGRLLPATAQSATKVQPQQPLIAIQNSELSARAKVLEARLKRYRDQRQGIYGASAELPKLDAIIQATLAELTRVEERIDQLTVRAASGGELYWLPLVEEGGDYVERGQQLGTIRSDNHYQLRGYVTEGVADRLRNQRSKVVVRSSDGKHLFDSGVSLQVLPSAATQLSDIAFTLEGGGQFARDGRDVDNIATLRPVVAISLTIDNFPVRAFKERLYVRVSHAPESLAKRFWRFFEAQFLSFLKA